MREKKKLSHTKPFRFHSLTPPAETEHCGLTGEFFFPWSQIIDFAINKASSPSAVKKRLLGWPNSPFVHKAEVLYYRCASGREIQVNVTPEWLSPYLPGAARLVQDIAPGSPVPYISVEDLVVFKIDSCGHQATEPKKERDARDAIALLELASVQGPLFLQDHQERLVEEGMADVIAHTARDKGWWEGRLGLPESETNTLMSAVQKSPAITVVVGLRKTSI